MHCPRDNTLLEDFSVDGIKLYVCPHCHGVLVLQNEFEKIQEHTKVRKPNTKRSEIKIEEGTASSPVSGEVMKVIDHDGIKIDVCLSSNYIWFDHGELEALYKTKTKNLGKDQSFNILDSLDPMDLVDILGEVVGAIFNGAANLIDF